MGEAHPSDALKHISCYKNVADMFMCVPNKNCYWYVKHFFKMSLELTSKALFYFNPTTMFPCHIHVIKRSDSCCFSNTVIF